MSFPYADAAVFPKLTILVAAWNEGDNIQPFIQSYLDLDYPRKELILCAGGSDGTYQKAVQYAGGSVVVIPQKPGEGKQRALRRGFEHSTGDILLLTDADCLLNQDALMRLVDPILQGEDLVTSGHCKPKRSQLSHPFVFYQYALQQRRQPAIQKRKYLKALLGRNCAIHRTVLEEVGSFNEEISIGTDSFLAKKVITRGYQIRLVPESVVETEFPSSLRAYFHQRSRWKRNGILHNLKFRLYRRVGSALFHSTRGLTLLVLPILGLWFGWSILFLWASIIAYSFLVRFKYVYSLRKSHKLVSRSIYWKIPLYFLVECGAPAFALVQMLFPRARNQW